MSDAEQYPPVFLALLNWNAWRLTIDCLESVARLQYPEPGVVLCDNESTDESVEHIREWARSGGWGVEVVDHSDGREGTSVPETRLLIVRSDRNRGFAGGTNLAIRYGMTSRRGYRYVWVLNTDTIVNPDALTLAVKALEQDPRAAAAQSLLIRARERSLLDSAGMRLLGRGGAVDMLSRKPVSELANLTGGRSVVPIFGCCAAAALYRISVLDQHGSFDELLHTGYEDVDLACRLQQNGYSALLAAQSIVYHLGGLSRDKKNKGLPWWRAHRNKLWIVARWYPRGLAVPILLFGLIRIFIASFRTPGITLVHWWSSLMTTVKQFKNGASGSMRRRLFRLGTAGVLR